MLTAAAAAQPSINSVLQSNLQDVSFEANVVSSNASELRKINRDFLRSHELQNGATVRMKTPFKLRLDADVEGQRITFIVNGTRRQYAIPRAAIKRTENLADQPGRRQTAFDFGLLTPALFDSFLEAEYVRTQRGSGEYVFDVFYQDREADSTRYRIWVDPEKKYVTKREWYSQMGGHLMAIFTYENPKKFGSVWLPTKVTVRNSSNNVAGVTRYDNIKVNSGISNSVFQL